MPLQKEARSNSQLMYGLKTADPLLPSVTASCSLKLQGVKTVIVEIHLFLATNVIYFMRKTEYNICLLNCSCALRDKLCLAAAAPLVSGQAG